MIRVWDRLVRFLHWALACAIVGAWIATERSATWHEGIGYFGAALVTVRVGWGFVGPRRARFSNFVRAPKHVASYVRTLAQRNEVRFIGHNPLGGWMVVALLACVGSICLTGWLYTTDAFWGEAWLSDLHAALAWTLVGLVALHVAGVIFTSVRHRENLVRAMLDGAKRVTGPGDID